MLVELCGDDTQKWQEAEYRAKKALASRIKFWDMIYNSMSK